MKFAQIEAWELATYAFFYNTAVSPEFFFSLED